MPARQQQPQEPRPSLVSVRTVGVLTNFIKLGGLVVAVNEALLRSELRPSALAVAAFMMAGAQGIEQLVGGLFGQSSSDKD